MNNIQNWESVTRGAVGIFDILAVNIFGIKFTMQNAGYYCLLVYTALAIAVTRPIINSRFGRAMKAAREDVMASTLIGINNQSYSVIAYVLSSREISPNSPRKPPPRGRSRLKGLCSQSAWRTSC